MADPTGLPKVAHLRKMRVRHDRAAGAQELLDLFRSHDGVFATRRQVKDVHESFTAGEAQQFAEDVTSLLLSIDEVLDGLGIPSGKEKNG